MANTSNQCRLCGTGCVACGGNRCRCKFDPLLVYKANQTVDIAGEFIKDYEDKENVKRMIFEGKSPEEIKEWLSTYRTTEKEGRVKEERKRVMEQELIKKQQNKIQAIANAEHKFDGISDSSICMYCHGTRFYHKNTPCTALQKIMQDTLD